MTLERRRRKPNAHAEVETDADAPAADANETGRESSETARRDTSRRAAELLARIRKM